MRGLQLKHRTETGLLNTNVEFSENISQRISTENNKLFISLRFTLKRTRGMKKYCMQFDTCSLQIGDGVTWVQVFFVDLRLVTLGNRCC